MTKTFIRVGSYYRADAPQLDGDLDLSSLLGHDEKLFDKENIIEELKEETAPEKHIPVPVDYSKQIYELNKRIDELTTLVNTPKETAVKEVVPKKEAVKKK